MDADASTAWVADRLAERADPVRAASMAAYMKTDMPFYGVGRDGLRPILRELHEISPVETAVDYERLVRALWARPHREEKYIAIEVAKRHVRFIETPRLPLYRQLVTEGAWWDFVDTVAAHLVGRLLLDDRPAVAPIMRQWVDDPDMWVRRTAILSQLTHKEQTDASMLFEFCLGRAHEKEFFIRKAIGWSLRQYARVEPDEVRAFLVEHRDRLSGLSFREAAKHLGEIG